MERSPHDASPIRVEAAGKLTAAQVAAVVALVDDATDTDGVRPLSEHVLLHLRYGGDSPARNLFVWSGDQLAAYAHLDVTDRIEGPSTELVVAPTERRHGYGRALIENMLQHTDGRLRLWAHGDLPEASLMASRLGFRRSRVLWQMRRSLAAPLPRMAPPEGVTVRTFNAGSDDESWLALNARAFAEHPEQGDWTLDDLHQRMHEDWFDPAGFFLAERDERLIGFHWTKVHGDAGDARHERELEHEHGHGHEFGHAHRHGHRHGLGAAPGVGHGVGHGHDPIGEVYVLGIDPTAHGHGLGRFLTVVGLRHLRAKGLLDVMLYVDESNVAAIRLYESLGFSRWNTDVLFRHG
ncbi:MAG: mycothiol synthase [Acidothermaceae bacterium]